MTLYAFLIMLIKLELYVCNIKSVHVCGHISVALFVLVCILWRS